MARVTELAHCSRGDNGRRLHFVGALLVVGGRFAMHCLMVNVFVILARAWCGNELPRALECDAFCSATLMSDIQVAVGSRALLIGHKRNLNGVFRTILQQISRPDPCAETYAADIYVCIDVEWRGLNQPPLPSEERLRECGRPFGPMAEPLTVQIDRSGWERCVRGSCTHHVPDLHILPAAL